MGKLSLAKTYPEDLIGLYAPLDICRKFNAPLACFMQKESARFRQTPSVQFGLSQIIGGMDAQLTLLAARKGDRAIRQIRLLRVFCERDP